MRPRLLACLILAAGFSGTPRAQTPTATITIDVSATDASGAPLTTLRAQDLMLRIDNRVHPIGALQLVQYESQVSLLPAPYATNQVAPGRTIALAVDVTRLSASHAAVAKDGIRALLPALGPRDRVGLVALALDGSAVPFTSRHDRILSAVTTMSGGGPAVSAGEKAEEAAAIGSLTLLEQLCTTLASEPGFKTVVFIAPAFATSSATRRAIQSVSGVTAQHRIRLIVVDPGSTTGARAGGLSALAAATGGVMLAAADSAADTFATIASQTTTRYELQFTPTSRQRNGKPHRVQVVSLQPDALVTSPPAVFIADEEIAVEPMPALTDMLRESRAHRDLPLRLMAYPILDADPEKLRLLILGETEDPSRTLAWAEFALVSPSGTIVAQWKSTSAEAAVRPLVTVVLAPPGPYRLRMAASEISGRRGAVDYEFDARLTPAGALSMGPLMLGGMANNSFVPSLQPAADATAIMGYTEIYGDPLATDTLEAQFEIARTIGGDALVSGRGSVRTTADAGRRAALGTLDLPPLPAGDYLVRAIITLNGAEIGRVTRTLRLVSR